MHKLRDILHPVYLQILNAHFPFDVGRVDCDWGDTDGAGNMGAGASSYGLFTKYGKITFDPADIPQSSDVDFTPLIKEIVIHELIHIEQYRRGFFYRLKMWYWRKFVSYEKRPHEIEA